VRRTAFSPQRKHSIHTPIHIGKYLVSPLTKRRPDRQFSASVSIRSGAGSQTHDRVLRLTPTFGNPEEAAQFAIDQGIAWLNARDSQPTPQEA
jgi:hypothetical protein